ncbi:MAG TPA: hypothetical protein PKA88_13750 [Polyangiaceae bacterium]|nr:hypothetical protein [Polyangiaceae bacterium]
MSRRSRTLHHIQRRLERIYGLESTPNVVDYVRTAADGGRETLLVRQDSEYLEIALILPPGEPKPAEGGPCDLWFQLAEGVSHFVYVTERARTELPTTQLELELQAEVDKFVLLAHDRSASGPRKVALRHRLFERVAYLHPAGTEAGERYRMANDLAARFVSRLMAIPDRAARTQRLRRFYRAGQADKIHFARAA